MKLGVDVQVWTYSEEYFNDWKDEFSSMPETAVNAGKEIDLAQEIFDAFQIDR